MRVADYIAERCKKLNDHVFMFVGGGAMYLNDAIGHCGIKYICMHNEQALAMATEAYARITNKPSVCIVTSGPGGTNAITGVYGAWTDSIPMIVISGQVRRPLMKTGNLRQLGDQELNIIDLIRPITKYASVIDDPKMVKYEMDLALYYATSERPGPVWLDVPLDVQVAPYEEIPLDIVHYPPSHEELDLGVVRKVAELLWKAKRPVIIAGSGIRSANAVNAFWRVMKKYQVPAIPSFNATDLGQFKYSAFGMLGSTYSNDIINQADLVLILGCRMNIRQTGYDFGKLGRDATKIMVDIDPAELNKYTFVPDMKIEADVGGFLNLLEAVTQYPITNYWCKAITPTYKSTGSDYVNPYVFIQQLNRFTEPGDIVVCSNGMVPTVASRALHIKEGMRLIINSGCGAMGYGLPAAIGAAFASGRRIICLEGDGSIQLNIQELQTLVHHDLPVKVFVFNNAGYNSIKNTQDAYFNGFYVGKDSDSGISFPEMTLVSEAYGIPCRLVHCDEDLEYVIDATINRNGPAMCDLHMDPNIKLEKAEI